MRTIPSPFRWATAARCRDSIRFPTRAAPWRKNRSAAEQIGFNAYLLAHAANPHFVVADGKGVESVKVEKVAGTYALSVTQEHWSIEGRGLVREATLERYREDEDFVKKIAGDDELPPKLAVTLYSIRRSPPNSNGEWRST